MSLLHVHGGGHRTKLLVANQRVVGRSKRLAPARDPRRLAYRDRGELGRIEPRGRTEHLVRTAGAREQAKCTSKRRERRYRGGVPLTPTLEELHRGDPHAIQLLAASDVGTWDHLTANMSGIPACPEALTRALIAIDDVEGWRVRGSRTASGRHPDYAMGIWYFVDWFGAGLVQHLPHHPAAFQLRYEREREYLEPDAAARLAVFADEIEEHADSPAHDAVLGRVLVLLARRLFEDGDVEAARAAAERADGIFTRLDDAAFHAQAMGLRAAALLRQARIDEALALHDALSADGKPWYGVHVRSRPVKAPPVDPTEAALAAAAKVILEGHPNDDPAWLDALDPIATHVAHAGAAARVAAGRRKLAEREGELQAMREESARLEEARQRAGAAARINAAHERASAADDDDVPGPYR